MKNDSPSERNGCGNVTGRLIFLIYIMLSTWGAIAQFIRYATLGDWRTAVMWIVLYIVVGIMMYEVLCVP